MLGRQGFASSAFAILALSACASTPTSVSTSHVGGWTAARVALSGRLTQAPDEADDADPCPALSPLLAEDGYAVAYCYAVPLRLRMAGRRDTSLYDLQVSIDERHVEDGGLTSDRDSLLDLSLATQPTALCGRFRVTVYRRGDQVIRVLNKVISGRDC